ncbi:hypothetical protein C1X61_05405 [Pseudomonas sp. FW215-T2]|nr:hypothetical protein C1X61_05405 [Pseudomonas sp. FW215-T2]PNA14613.1 hypothetical protein C1X62_06785 [Pseudomonas sp. FW215-R3]PNB38590.1 hypothetical protein C1X63_07230 [Pseudomonas sp. FW305-131]
MNVFVQIARISQRPIVIAGECLKWIDCRPTESLRKLQMQMTDCFTPFETAEIVPKWPVKCSEGDLAIQSREAAST